MLSLFLSRLISFSWETRRGEERGIAELSTFCGSHHALAFQPDELVEKGRSAERWSALLVFMNSGATGLPASDLISKPSPSYVQSPCFYPVFPVARPPVDSRSAVTSSSYINNWPRYSPPRFYRHRSIISPLFSANPTGSRSRYFLPHLVVDRLSL